MRDFLFSFFVSVGVSLLLVNVSRGQYARRIRLEVGSAIMDKLVGIARERLRDGDPLTPARAQTLALVARAVSDVIDGPGKGGPPPWPPSQSLN